MASRFPRVVPASEIAPVLDDLHARLAASRHAPEMDVQIHEYLDIDPDLADRPYPPMPWARTATLTDFERSDAAGYVTRAYPATDCEPQFAPRPTVTDVETGGRL